MPSCGDWLRPPTPDATITQEPAEPEDLATSEPFPTPAVTLPPLVPVALDQPADPGLLVHVELGTGDPWPGEARPVLRRLAVVAPAPLRPWKREKDLWTYAFEARVTLPRDLAPGHYYLHAYQPKGTFFGDAALTVVPSLAETGAHTVPLVRLGLLSLLTGTAALVTARRAR